MAEIIIREKPEGFHVNSDTDEVGVVTGMEIKVDTDSPMQLLRMIAFLMHGLITERNMPKELLLAAIMAGLDTDGTSKGILGVENRHDD